MKISRRSLVKLGLVQTGLSTIPISANEPLEDYVRRRSGPSVVQGPTDETHTQFTVVHQVGVNLKFRIFDSENRSVESFSVKRINRPGAQTTISRLEVSGLSLGEDYSLRILQGNGSLLDERRFSTLDTSSSELRFAICSCMDEKRHDPGIWQDLVAQKPDFILFVGDSVYCDSGGGQDEGPARFWRRFSESRSTLEIYFSKQLIPIFATWDDHDFGLNDSGLDFPYAADSLKNFLNFFPMNPRFASQLKRGPGVSSAFVMGGQQFILMDDRTYREPGFSQERYAHWGQEQEEWMLDCLREHQGFTWIANGTQMLPQMIFKQSFSGQHPVQFEEFRKAVRDSKKRVALISGDVHFSEISELEPALFGYKTYELTSSSIHSYKLPGLPGLIPNSRRIASTGEHNYLLVESKARGSGAQFTVTSRSSGNGVNFERSFSI